MRYANMIDGIAIESVFFLAHDKPANMGWCAENRRNALALKAAGKLALGVDYAKKRDSIVESYRRQRAAGFVPYVAEVSLSRVVNEPQ